MAQPMPSNVASAPGTAERGPAPTGMPSNLAVVPWTPKKGLLIHVKAWAWRFTASYLWVRWVLLILSGRNMLAGIEGATANGFVTLLASVGFAPSNVTHLPMVFIAIWLLSITTFSPGQLVIGLPLYIIFAPFWFLIATLYRKTLKAARENPPADAAQAPMLKRRFPLASLSISLILGWLLLYGGSFARGPNIVGCVVSGVLFLTLAYRALGKTSGIDERDMALLTLWAIRGILFMSNTAKKAMDKPPKNKRELDIQLGLIGYLIDPFRRLRVIFRGDRGKDRISMMMLGEYIFFLLLLAASAILFWAFALKVAVTSQQALSLTTALTISASHFLPAINKPSTDLLPWWAEFGPALTSWVLFVVYIGPVASALPLRQQDFVKRLTPIKNGFTKVAKLWHVYRRLMKSLDKAFIKQQMASAKNH